MNELLKQISEWIEGFESDFETFKTKLERDLSKVEASILRRVLSDILPLVSQDGGYLKAGALNLSRANLIERVFDEIEADELRPILTRFADEMLAIPGKNAAYYILTGQDEAKVKAIAKDLNLIRGIIGIDANGNLLNNGYLSRLGRSEAVREQLKGYLLTSIATKQKVSEFERGLKLIVSGNSEVDGAITGYWRQYAYDTYARVREVDNLHFADELELNDFVYQGGVIKTSRDFCIKKNGKVFSRAEALKNWPNDPDLIDKKHKASYKPLIDRGRNNCRHFLMWISAERAKELRAEQQ